jgi:hypothetical protein
VCARSKTGETMIIVLVLLVLLPLAQNCQAQSSGTVTSLGAHPDGTASTETTAAFRTAFANNPVGEIVVPPGRYLIDNSEGPLTITNFSGRLMFQGAAELVFADNRKGGFLFEGGTGAIISDLRATYATPPLSRSSPNEELMFSHTINTIVMNAIVRNSPGAGIVFVDSVNPNVTNASVFNSLADGLNFSNCQNARVINLLTLDTGDDGLAFVNYARHPNLTGAVAQNIVITNSRARGIAIAGQSDVTVSGFQIKNTSSSGVLVAQDTAHNTRVPANVFIENGSIYDAGTMAPLVGNQYGLEFNSQKNVTFANIAVFNSGNSGLSGTAPAGSVTVNNVFVDSPLAGMGLLFYKTKSVHVTSSTTSGTPSYGFLSLQSDQIIVEGLTVRNAGMTDSLRRAVWFEDAQTILASTINILSRPGTARLIGCSSRPDQSVSSGSVKIIGSIANGAEDANFIANSCTRVTFVP